LLLGATRREEVWNSEGNVLFIDCGDLVQGGAESWLSGGAIMLKGLEWLDCDAWVLGNHEFDWGPDALQALHDQTTIPMLAANVRKRAGVLAKLKPFIVKEMDGIRVAVIGLTTPGVPLWLPQDLRKGFVFESSRDALARVLPLVRVEEPDVMILAAHQGLQAFGDDEANEIRSIASSFPEIDLIIGAHTHKVYEDVRLNGVLYAQAGYYGNWLGRVDLVYDTVRREVEVAASRAIPVQDAVAPCAGLAEYLGEDLTRAEAYLEETIGMASAPLRAEMGGSRGSAIQELIARAIVEKTGAELVLHGVFNERGLEDGEIRMADIWDIVPYENKIGLLSLTAAELREVLAENLGLADTTHFLGIYGMSYGVDPAKDGPESIQDLLLTDGTRPHGKRRFRVAANSYVLSSGGGRFKTLRRLAFLPETRLEMTDIDTRTAVIDYVRDHSPLAIRHEGILHGADSPD